MVIFPLLVSKRSDPFLVAISLLSKDSNQELIVLKGLSNGFLVSADTFGDITQCIIMLVQQKHLTTETFHRLHLRNQVTLLTMDHRHVCLSLMVVFRRHVRCLGLNRL